MTDEKNQNNEILSSQEEANGTPKFGEKQMKTIVYGVVALLTIGLGWWWYEVNVLEPQSLEAKEMAYQPNENFATSVMLLSNGAYTNQFFIDYRNDLLNKTIHGKMPDSVSSENFDGLIAVAEQYPSTPTGKLANYQIGVCYLHLGKYENAIEYLTKFDIKDPVLSPMALGCIGDAYVNLEQYDKAMEYYKKAVNYNKNNITAGMFLKKSGLVQEHLGNIAEANKIYKKIKAEYPSTLEAQSVDFYIARTAQ